MTVKQLIDSLELELVVDGDTDRSISTGYCGDLLSWVMGRAPADSVWFTVMGNVNAVAVCVLADVACMVLCENSPLDDLLCAFVPIDFYLDVAMIGQILQQRCDCRRLQTE